MPASSTAGCAARESEALGSRLGEYGTQSDPGARTDLTLPPPLARPPCACSLVEACGKHCPGALLNIISNPVNSTVPIAAEVLRKLGVYDERRLLGVTTLDVVSGWACWCTLRML